MKKVIFNLVVASFVFGLLPSSCDVMFPVHGNGKIVESERQVATFDKIAIADVADVRYHASDEYRVVVAVDSNLEEHVDIHTRNNVLNIKTDRMVNCVFTKFTVDVYCPVLTGVTLSGSGKFVGIDTIVASKFESSITGSGKMEGVFECDHFSVKISGSGKIAATGNTQETQLSISGSGDFKGNDFITQNATVNVSGSGKVTIYVVDHLKATISGSGGIYYGGNPDIDSRISGSGRIKKL